MLSQFSDTALIALGLIIILVITINLGLWAAWKRKKAQNQFDWLRGLSQTLRNPWQSEDEMMQKLSSRLERLKQDSKPIEEYSPQDTSKEHSGEITTE
jgi:hypothetical protein